MPSSKGRIPIKTNAIMEPVSGALQGSNPNRFIIDVGSGADRSLNGPNHDA